MSSLSWSFSLSCSYLLSILCFLFLGLFFLVPLRCCFWFLRFSFFLRLLYLLRFLFLVFIHCSFFVFSFLGSVFPCYLAMLPLVLVVFFLHMSSLSSVPSSFPLSFYSLASVLLVFMVFNSLISSLFLLFLFMFLFRLLSVALSFSLLPCAAPSCFSIHSVYVFFIYYFFIVFLILGLCFLLLLRCSCIFRIHSLYVFLISCFFFRVLFSCCLLSLVFLRCSWFFSLFIPPLHSLYSASSSLSLSYIYTVSSVFSHSLFFLRLPRCWWFLYLFIFFFGIPFSNFHLLFLYPFRFSSSLFFSCHFDAPGSLIN